MRADYIPALLFVGILYVAPVHAELVGRDLDGNLSNAEAYYDTVLGITWMANVQQSVASGYDSDGLMTWLQSVAWADQLVYGGYDDWRLPSVEPVNGISFNYSYATDGSTDIGYNIVSPNSEFSYMYYVNLGNDGYRNPDGSTTTGNYGLVDTGPFLGLIPGLYWYEPDYAPDGALQWVFDTYYGAQKRDAYGAYNYAWAVHDGDIGVSLVPEPASWAMLLLGLGLIGLIRQRNQHA